MPERADSNWVSEFRKAVHRIRARITGTTSDGFLAEIKMRAIVLVLAIMVGSILIINVGLGSHFSQIFGPLQQRKPNAFSATTPTPDVGQTDAAVGWEPFASSIHGFVTQYPSGWSVFEYSKADSGPDISGEFRVTKFRNFFEGSMSLESAPDDIEVTVSYYRTDSPLKDWINDFEDKWLLNPDDDAKIEWLTTDGRPVLRISRYNERLAPIHIQENFFFDQTSVIWRISVSGHRDQSDAMVEIALMMIRRFNSAEGPP